MAVPARERRGHRLRGGEPSLLRQPCRRLCRRRGRLGHVRRHVAPGPRLDAHPDSRTDGRRKPDAEEPRQARPHPLVVDVHWLQHRRHAQGRLRNRPGHHGHRPRCADPRARHQRLGFVAYGRWTRQAIESTPWREPEDALRFLDIGQDDTCSVTTTASGDFASMLKPLDTARVPGLQDLLETPIASAVETVRRTASSSTPARPTGAPSHPAERRPDRPTPVRGIRTSGGW